MMAGKFVLRCVSVAFAAFLVTLAVPVSATKWMVIGADPAPRRSVYIIAAENTWISRRMDDGVGGTGPTAPYWQGGVFVIPTIYSVRVLQVFENAVGKNFTSYTLEFRCGESSVSIPEVISYDRAGKQKKSGSPAWMKVPDNWMAKAELIACKRQNWETAKLVWGEEGAPPPKRKKRKEPAVSFASLGMEYLGEANYYTVTEVVDLVWNQRWADAVQPAYLDEGTPVQKAAIRAKALAQQNQIKSVLEDRMQKVEQDIQTQDKIDKKLGRIGDKFFRQMQGVAGKSEADVLALWGTPQGLVETTPGVRQLNYYWQDTESVMVPYQVDIMGNVGGGVIGKVGETTNNRLENRTVRCYRKLFLRQGGQLPGYRVFDFDIGCS